LNSLTLKHFEAMQGGSSQKKNKSFNRSRDETPDAIEDIYQKKT
jgi:hypothetical protein